MSWYLDSNLLPFTHAALSHINFSLVFYYRLQRSELFFLNYFQFCTSTTYYMFCNRSLSSPLSSHFLQVAKLLEDHLAQCFDALILTFLIQENNPSDLPFPFCMELRRRATTSVSMSALMRAYCFSGGFSHLPQSSCTVRSEYEKVSHLTRT